jgi:LemA protein
MWVLIAIGVLLLFAVLLIFNSLVVKKNQIKNIFGTLDALLKKRYDLIPNLVSTVKGYMQHERSVLEEITELRAKAVSPAASAQSQAAIGFDTAITGLLGKIMLSVENYPQLKANENFLHLQHTLVELEEQISAARRAYNASVIDYNNAVQMFPSSIIASIFGYKTKPLFEARGHKRKNVEVGRMINL